MLRDELILVLKRQQWQKIVGELKSFVSLEGSKLGNSKDCKFEEIEGFIDQFIANIEENGLDD